MKLSDAWMIFVFLALTMYVVLDGYDLGIGVLTLLDRDSSRRREMQSLVAWTCENDGLRWPRRDGLKWPHLASVVVGVDVA
jgi:hypothetical protein